MKLHGFAFSPNSRRAELGLAEYGVDYTIETVDLQKGAQFSPEFRALNPNAKVPVLEDGDTVLFESNAILFYLAAKFPERKLEGTTPSDKAEVAKWMFFNTAHLGPSGAQLFAHTVMLPEDKRIAAVAENARTELHRCLGVVDQTLSNREYLAGAFSIADLCMAPNVHFVSKTLRIDLEQHPAVKAWLGRVSERPSWKKVYG